MPTEIYAQPIAVRGLTRLADRHDHAPPIGVAPGNGGLHRRRIGNRKPHAPCGFVALCAAHVNADQLLRAFAVTNNLKREIKQKGVKFLAEVPQTPITRFCDLRMGGTFPRGKDEKGVVCRGVAIDGNRVERIPYARRKKFLEHRRGKVRVRENKSEERRHVGRDHAGTLGDAVDGHAVIFDHCTRGRHFGKRVRRHDGLRRGTPAACRTGIGEVGHDSCDLVRGQRFPNHPGRRHEHLACVAIERGSSRSRHFAYRVPAGGAGERIGISAIGDERAGCPFPQIGPAPFDRS